MKSVLFITWDGPQTSYLEGLFFPIFGEIAKREEYEFHVIQFTWADRQAIERIEAAAAEHKCHYTPVVVGRGKCAALGKIGALFYGHRKIARYAVRHNIDLIMPRSTIPASMTGFAARRLRGRKIIFDADGFSNMERVEFGGQKKDSLVYRLRERAEQRMLKNADAVLVRSARAIEIHLQDIGERFRSKFFVVANGRDPQLFRPDPDARRQVRERLGVAPETTLFIYCGSLGPQYLPDEMLEIFAGYKRSFPDAKFLVLTGDASQIEKLIPLRLRDSVTIMHVPFSQIPGWLSGGDIAFSLRRPAFSMQGVAPVKLGEYMMMGLPTIASAGIGDTEKILERSAGAFLYDYADPERMRKAVEWCAGLSADRDEIREFGIKNFSLSQSAKNYIDAFRFVFPQKMSEND